jgi:hypothetical protein
MTYSNGLLPRHMIWSMNICAIIHFTRVDSRIGSTINRKEVIALFRRTGCTLLCQQLCYFESLLLLLFICWRYF